MAYLSVNKLNKFSQMIGLCSQNRAFAKMAKYDILQVIDL